MGLINMIGIIRWTQDFGLIDIIDIQCLQDLGFGYMANATLGHHRNGYRLLDTLDHFGIAHSRYTTSCTNIRWNAFQRHNGTSPSLLSNLGLFRCRDIHDDTTLQHLCKSTIDCFIHFFLPPCLFMFPMVLLFWIYKNTQNINILRYQIGDKYADL